MSTGRAYWLVCDECYVEFEASDATRLTLVRKEARTEGWITGPKGDFCPEHSAPNEETP